MFLLELIKICILAFFAMFFLLALTIGGIDNSSDNKRLPEDSRKQVFMEDCLGVTMNTKAYCERTFKELTEETI